MHGKPLNGKTIGILAVLLVLLVLFMAAGVAGEERTDAGGQWKYVLEDGGATITGYVEEPPEDLVFPAELDGYPVTAINRWVSGEVYITSVTIADGVTRIGAGAFADHANEWSGFSSLTIPNSVVSIGDSAFFCCRSLTAVIIPAGVTDIGKNPFEGCPMTRIDVAAGNPVYEQVDGVLFDKQRKMLVSYPHAREEKTYAIPEGVLRIGDGAFSNNYTLTDVIIPDSVTGIGDMAFWACAGLTGVTIPDGVTSIGDMAFKECDNLASVIVPASVTSIGEEAFGWGEVTLSVKAGSYAEQYAEENGIPYTYGVPEGEEAAASGQWTYVLEDGGATITGYKEEPSGDLVIPSEIDGVPVTGIGDSVFEECEGITSVTIPAGVTSIGVEAFSWCESLMSVVIPDRVTSIGDGAFFWCESLIDVTIPDSVTDIGIYTFKSCIGLESVTIPDSVTSIGDSAFYNCPSLTSVTLPDSVTSIGYWAFGCCESLTSVIIPASVTAIDKDAFADCEELTLSVAEGSYAEQYALENNIAYVLTTPAAATADDEVFPRIDGSTFTFSSGVGGWSTEVTVSEDGSFTGYFHDSDMGDTGDDYPDGTRYECNFSGTFVVTRKTDQYTYELRLVSLDIKGDTGVERIVDGVRVISADAYGMEGGDVFMLYCPGRETADLPEAFLEWVCMPNAWEEAPDALPFYGLYNVDEGTGFFSYAE